MKRYWLMKSEPDVFSIDDLARKKKEPWTGVRGYQARNYMRDEMHVGDTVLFYHSSCDIPGIYGLGKVASPPYPDPTQFDATSEYYDPKAKRDAPTWFLVDVAYVRKLKEPVTLESMRRNKKLKTMMILEPGTRLSITPVSPKEFATLGV